jgi:hypothetical protein
MGARHLEADQEAVLRKLRADPKSGPPKTPV